MFRSPISGILIMERITHPTVGDRRAGFHWVGSHLLCVKHDFLSR